MTALTIGSSKIRQIDGFYSLNDLHVASGGAEKHQPAFFLRNEQTKALIEEVNSANLQNLNAGNPAIKTERGKYGGTYACKELVIAYAAWISPAFHLKVIRVFLAQVGRTLLAETITKAQQGELATLIAERFPSGKDRPYAWSRFNNHFRLASYKDLPANRFGEACEYIKTMPEPVPAIPANYNYPLESARPKRTIGRTAWMTVDVLLDERNPAPEMDLLATLEKAGYDVEGVRLRIESMHYQLEEYRKFRRRLKDLCEDVSVNRGRNVNFLPSGNMTARIAID